jgi:hypothetical protein
VPAQVHRRLKAKAALRGQSLSSYLLAEIQRLAERPSEEEILQRIHQRAAVTPSSPPTDVVREEREVR